MLTDADSVPQADARDEVVPPDWIVWSPKLPAVGPCLEKVKQLAVDFALVHPRWRVGFYAQGVRAA